MSDINFKLLMTDGTVSPLSLDRQRLQSASTQSLSQVQELTIDLQKCQKFSPQNIQEFINHLYNPCGTWYIVDDNFNFKLDITILFRADKFLQSLLISFEHNLPGIGDDNPAQCFLIFLTLIRSEELTTQCRELAKTIFMKFGAILFFNQQQINPYVKEIDKDQVQLIVKWIPFLNERQRERTDLFLSFLKTKEKQFNEGSQEKQDYANQVLKQIYFSDINTANLMTLSRIQVFLEPQFEFEVLTWFKENYQNNIKTKENEIIVRELRKHQHNQDSNVYHDLSGCRQKNCFAVLICGHRQCLICAKSVTLRDGTEYIRCFKSLNDSPGCQAIFSEADRAKIPFN